MEFIVGVLVVVGFIYFVVKKGKSSSNSGGTTTTSNDPTKHSCYNCKHCNGGHCYKLNEDYDYFHPNTFSQNRNKSDQTGECKCPYWQY